jgi:hypothetical protein
MVDLEYLLRALRHPRDNPAAVEAGADVLARNFDGINEVRKVGKGDHRTPVEQITGGVDRVIASSDANQRDSDRIGFKHFRR